MSSHAAGPEGRRDALARHAAALQDASRRLNTLAGNVTLPEDQLHRRELAGAILVALEAWFDTSPALWEYQQAYLAGAARELERYRREGP